MDLCSNKFIADIDPEHWGYQECQGLMTDVEALKENGLKVSAVNMSCGYYNPHSDEEITVKRDLEKCWRLVQHIIEDCTEVYPHEADYNGGYGYYEWDLEEEIYSFLQQDPTLTASDLYDMYQTNYPRLTHADFERIVQDFHLLYFEDDYYEPFNTKNNEEEKCNNTKQPDTTFDKGGKSGSSHSGKTL